MLDVVTLGETMFLVTPWPGTIESASVMTGEFGGAESNVAIGLARLGHKVGWMSMLGDDPFGHYILLQMKKGIARAGLESHVKAVHLVDLLDRSL